MFTVRLVRNIGAGAVFGILLRNIGIRGHEGGEGGDSVESGSTT